MLDLEKTEVAIRAAFKAVMDGKQVAILVPTTVLCQQHYTTFKERLADFPVQIESLSRFHTATEQRELVGLIEGWEQSILLLERTGFFRRMCGSLIWDW